MRKTTLPEVPGASPLPTALALVARDAEWHYVVQMVALGIVHTVSGQVRLNLFAFDVEAEAVATIVADLPKLGLEPSRRDEVVSQWSAVQQVLLSVVINPLRQVAI